MPKPYVDLYKAAWPNQPENIPMETERNRVRASLTRLLTGNYEESLSPEQRAAVQWQGVALALVDVIAPEDLPSLVNDFPIAFQASLQAICNQARIADFNERDRGHVPLRAPTREQGEGAFTESGDEANLVELLAECSAQFRFYEESHRAKIAPIEEERRVNTYINMEASFEWRIGDATRKADANKAFADKIDAAIAGRSL